MLFHLCLCALRSLLRGWCVSSGEPFHRSCHHHYPLGPSTLPCLCPLVFLGIQTHIAPPRKIFQKRSSALATNGTGCCGCSFLNEPQWPSLASVHPARHQGLVFLLLSAAISFHCPVFSARLPACAHLEPPSHQQHFHVA